VDVFFLIFLLLLAISIVLGHLVSHRWKIAYLPEAGVTILVGMAASFVIRQQFSSEVTELMGFSPSIFFAAILPPIIFNSGYTMKPRYFVAQFMPIMAFAVVGTLVSTLLVGFFLYAVSLAGVGFGADLAECLTFGALISATDPVSTLAVFQALRVDPSLFYIVFGESVLNDAVAIVLFRTFSKFVGYKRGFVTIEIAVIDFFLIFIGSTAIGVVFGCLSALLFKHADLKHNQMHELGVYVLFSFVPFLFSEAVEMSGELTARSATIDRSALRSIQLNY
jgi:sodium/hydrogen exchanger 8